MNPYGARIILYWSLNDGTVFPADNSPGWYDLKQNFYAYMSTCNMTAYNITLSYSTLNENNSYTLADHPIPSQLQHHVCSLRSF